jgi:hypothetical protein
VPPPPIVVTRFCAFVCTSIATAIPNTVIAITARILFIFLTYVLRILASFVL